MRLLVVSVICLTVFAQDAQQIVRKGLVIEIDRQRKLDNYVWETVEIEKKLDGSNAVKKTETRSTEHLMLDGSEYRRLIAKDGKPLTEDDARKEQAKMDAEMGRRRAESPQKRAERQANHKKRVDEEIKFREEVLKAFDFKIAGEETVKGIPCWKITATPKADYVAQSRQGKMFLGKLQGSIWASKEGPNWLKIEAETTGKITFGGFLASISPGAHFLIEQFRVNSELWHPERIQISVNARALVQRFHEEVEVQFRNFRKFQTESKMLALESVEK